MHRKIAETKKFNIYETDERSYKFYYIQKSLDGFRTLAEYMENGIFVDTVKEALETVLPYLAELEA